MTLFRLQAPFEPTGDQPQAIAQLVDGVQSGQRFQTLLGATGTGKSIGSEEPVFVVEKQGNLPIPRIVPIGELIDKLIEQFPDCAWQRGDTVVLEPEMAGVEYYAQSFDPESGEVGLHPIASFIRHDAPETMYRLQTGCGRWITLTGDHNLWVLREGRLKLIKTSEAKKTDYIPLPQKLLLEGKLRYLDTLSILADKRLFVQAAEPILAYLDKHGPSKLAQAFTECGLNFQNKLYLMRHNQPSQGIRISQFLKLLKLTNNLEGEWDPSKVYISAINPKHGILAQQNLSDEFLRLLGYYLADGYSSKNAVTLGHMNEFVREDLEYILERLNISFRIRHPSKYEVGATPLAQLFIHLCGSSSKNKHLPEFWPQLPKSSLGQLLRAYFDGDGAVKKVSQVLVVTVSYRLACDLVYALLSLGIWGYLYHNSLSPKNFYEVVISGQADLRRYQDYIGFAIPYKQKALLAEMEHREHSQFDLVSIDGQQLRWLRNEVGLSSRDLAKITGMDRSTISYYEKGKNRPRRSFLIRVMNGLSCEAKQTSTGGNWWRVWKSMEQLCKLYWTSVAKVEKIDYQHPYVYDFSVPKTETFLAGVGGLFVHNTFTVASAISQIQRPTLVLAHNKTLAAQLCNELRQFFPQNAVEYFISYYDYYQPEAYIPVTDTYIEKSASINDEIDMLRHSATRSLFERRDVIVVASISCIYGLGMPAEYLKAAVSLQIGTEINQRQLLRNLATIQYSRNDVELERGRFRVRGDVLEIVPAYEDRVVRVEFFGDEIEAIYYLDPVTGKILQSLDSVSIYPARHFVTPEEQLEDACQAIKGELEESLQVLEKAGKLLEAQRLEQRTRYDLEMLQEVGYCNGVENYSRYLAGRNGGEPPECLIDYFPEDWLLVIDESHVTVPQLRGMYNGDQARKKVLIEHGFRLPSAADNRPLKAEEFWQKVNQCIFVSATPGNWELEQSNEQIIEQVIRPTGVIDPKLFVRPTEGQVDDLLGEIKDRIKRQERVLITTLTKRMAEDLTEYLQERDIRVQYLHSEIQSIERIEIIQALREGEFDVLVGVNLLREGLDLPEVSLVAILDADKEGFLRSERSLIQTIGRAARHVGGQAILYGDKLTDSMAKAIEETERRRNIQIAHNRMHGITPQSIVKKPSNSILSFLDISRRLNAQQLEQVYKYADDLPLEKVPELIGQLEEKMKEAAKNLEFEEAAKYRDQIKHLRDKLLRN